MSKRDDTGKKDALAPCRKNYQIVNLNSMRCVNNTVDRRIVNDMIISVTPHLDDNVDNISFLGKGKYGSVYKGCYPNKKNKSGKSACKFVVVIKKFSTDISAKDVKVSNNSIKGLMKVTPTNPDLMEIVSMKLSSDLVSKRATQNLPMLYSYKISEGSAEFISEFANGGDLNNWLLAKHRTSTMINNAMFQIFQGMYCLFKKYGISHNDLHWSNVLVHKVKPGGLWVYTIDGVKFYIPNLGFVFIIWDFGFAAGQTKEKNLIHDLLQISHSLKWANDDIANQKINIPLYKDIFRFVNLIKGYNTETPKYKGLFVNTFGDFMVRPKGYKIIDEFRV